MELYNQLVIAFLSKFGDWFLAGTGLCFAYKLWKKVLKF